MTCSSSMSCYVVRLIVQIPILLLLQKGNEAKTLPQTFARKVLFENDAKAETKITKKQKHELRASQEDLEFMDDASDEGDAHEDAADPGNEPNISYVVHKLSQVMHAPKMSDMKVAFEVLRCIEHSPGKGIQYSKSKDFQVNAFVDSDWPSALQPSQSLDICNVSWKVSCFMEK
ncbi:hypothetical protein Tco_0897562 [Tanacetum coccineum]